MAENAERSIQEMIPELQEMNKIGLFTVDETRKILKKRREFEYKLRRKTKENIDFTRYIQYEEHVLALVKLQRKKKKCMGMKKEIDICIVKRIHRLYKIVCGLFPQCLENWKQHIEFSLSLGERETINKIFNAAMKFHPKNEDLWILWAKIEMENHQSSDKARKVLQDAIHDNKESRKLYHEYFKMELCYANKLRKRQETLDIANLDAQSTIMKGEIALVVYKTAAVHFPDNVEFLLSFVNLCQPHPFASWISDIIYEDVKKNFTQSEIALAALAKRPLALARNQSAETEAKDISEAMKETCEGFEKALQTLSTELMWELYFDACLEMAKMSSSLANWAVDHTMKVFLRAVEENKVTEHMSLSWVDMLSKTGQISWGVEVIPLLTDKFPQCTALWQQQMKFQMLCSVDADIILSCLREALNHVGKTNECLPLWNFVIEWCLVSCPDKVIGLLEGGLLSGPREVTLSVKECYFDWAVQHLSIKSVRKLFKRLSTSPASLKLFQKYIAFELSQSLPKMKKIRHAYDLALTEFGSLDIDIWLKYLEMEMKHPLGNPGAIGILYDRAKKSLHESLVQAFVEKSVDFSMLQNNVTS